MQKKEIFLLLLLCAIVITGRSQSFVHPGILHTQEDFDRMISKVNANAQPWKDGWDRLVTNSHAQLSYTPNPRQSVCAGGGGCPNGESFMPLAHDCAAAYQCALRYRISGDTAYANKAVQIMNAWSGTLQEITGDSNAGLRAGLYGYQFAAAAEMMRNYSGWSSSDFNSFKNMMLTKFYPINSDFLIRHNGTCFDHYWANWDLANMASIIAIGVLCDDRAIFDEAVDYFKNGSGTGQIDHLVNHLYEGNPVLGQGQESGRDQGHATLCISLVGAFCQIAYNQGEDLFAYKNNKVLALCEYTAKYNLGDSVPFTPYTNCENFTMTDISSGARGIARPSWELIYNHYVNIKGLYAPYSQQFATAVRPEGGGGNYGNNSGGFDQLGFGTLTFTRDSATLSTPAEGTYKIIARHSGKALEVADNGTANGSNVRQWPSNDCECQQWILTNVGNNEYTIVGVASGKNLDVDGVSTANGANVHIWSSTGAANQRFTFTAAGGGYYRITPVHSGKAVDVNNVSTADGANIIQWQYTGRNNQQWRLDPVNTPPVANGTYKIIARHSGKALEVENNRTASGANVRQWTSNSCACQQWTLTHLGENQYSIVGVGSGKNLDVASGSLDNGANIQIWQSADGDNQKFTIAPTDSGYYRISPVHSGKALDVSGNSKSDGANVHQWPFKGGTNQQWRLESVSNARTGTTEEARNTEALSDEVIIYPNPVSDKIKIRLSNDYSKGTEMAVHDNLGKLITSIKISGKEHILDLSAVPQGVYIITLTNAKGSISRKVVKE